MSALEYAIGKPGQAPRCFVTTTWDQVALNIRDGEVAIHDPLPAKWPHVISADGTKVVASTIPLDWARRERWRQAKAFLDQRLAQGCSSPLGRVQVDADSLQAITLYATIASQNLVKVPAWSISWTMLDNTQVAHTAAQMVAMASAAGTYVAACHAASQAIRTSILAATTGEAAMAVNLDTGYPASS